MKKLNNLRPPALLLISLFFSLLLLPRLLSGQTPVSITNSSFNWDAIGEVGCGVFGPGLAIVTPGGMDASGYAFAGGVGTGWPVSGSYTLSGKTYQLQPYVVNNARLVLPGQTATLSLVTATKLANLSFLVTSTEGDASATYTANFTDATSQVLMTATTPDWIMGGGTFISNATSVNDCDVKGGGKLYQVSGNISAANYGKSVSSITVSRGGSGLNPRLYIFGASSCGAGAYFSTCPNNMAVSCPSSVSYTATAVGATSLSYSFSGATSGSGNGTGSGSSFNNGVTTVTLMATNSCGSQTCSFNVTVVDNIAPTAICRDITINVDNSGNITTNASAINNGSFDNCGLPVTLSLSQTHFNCGSVGLMNSVVLTVTDVNNNSAACTATVSVKDLVPPSFFCPSNISVNVASGTCSAKVCYPLPEAGDNCNPPAISGYTYYAQDGTLGPTTRYYYYSNTATDWITADADARAAGGHLAVFRNSSENLTAYLNLPNSLFPVWIGGTDAGQEGVWRWITCHTFGYTNWYTPTGEPNNSGGIENYMHMYNNGTWNDFPNSGFGTFRSILEIDGSKTVQTVGLAQDALFPIGPTTNTYVATDALGNTSSCTFTVNVNDNQPPTAICKNISVNLSGASVNISAAQIDNGSSDLCGGVTLSASPTSFSCANVGSNNVTLTVTDMSSNTVTCIATVMVVDNVAPVATCQNVTVQLGNAGNGSTSAAAVNNGSSDACGIANLTLNNSSFTCANVGSGNTVTLTVTDNNGNTSTCTATVMVVDNVAPVATCQNVTVQLGNAGNGSTSAAAVNNGSSDACGIANLTLNNSSFTCANVGSGNTVTLTVTDNNGNTSTCTATVTVQDNVAPVATCHNVTVQLDNAGNGSTSAAAVNNGSSDACGIANLTLNNSSFTCANVGSGNTVTLTVTDNNGNTSTCTATVTVVDNTPPTAICPANIVQNNNSGQCSAVINYSVSVLDNCSAMYTLTSGLASGANYPIGTTTNTFVVTDASGNTSTCSFTVSILLSADPTLIHSYTAIGFEEVKMKKNTVFSGGVGVVNAGKKAKLEQATMVTAANTFVKAPILDLNGGSTVATYHPGQVAASVLLPFQNHTNSCSNNVNVPDNGSTTLNLNCYDKIDIGKNATVIFSGNATVDIKELKAKDGASIYFAQNTDLRIKNHLHLDKNTTVTGNGKRVQFFVEDHVDIDEGSKVTGNIRAMKHIHVKNAKVTNPTIMTGLFIGEKIDAHDFVQWYRNENGCNPNPGNLLAQNQALLFSATKKGESETDLRWISKGNGTAEYFVIERSTDGQFFSQILQTDVLGNANEMLYFNELDKEPFAGENFYRLKMILQNSEERFSDIQKVVFPSGEISVYPNPTAGGTIFVSVKNFAGKTADIYFSNAYGQVLQTFHYEYLPKAPLTLPLDGLPSGTYFINLKMEGERYLVRPFIVQRP